MPSVTPWSYSSLSAFETCPRRYYLTKITKQVTEPQTEATLWGNEVHKALEHAVGGVAPLAPRFQQYQPIVSRLVATPAEKRTESKFGLTARFNKTTFFAKDVWVRGVLDLGLIYRDKRRAVVLDYKTGKPKSDTDQLELFAAVTYAQEPWLETIDTGYVWLAHNRVDKERFTPEDVPRIWSKFLPRVERMVAAQETDNWPARPSGLCAKWCPVGRRLCEHCGRD